MLSFIRVSMVVASIHSNKTLTKKDTDSPGQTTKTDSLCETQCTVVRIRWKWAVSFQTLPLEQLDVCHLCIRHSTTEDRSQCWLSYTKICGLFKEELSSTNNTIKNLTNYRTRPLSYLKIYFVLFYLETGSHQFQSALKLPTWGTLPVSLFWSSCLYFLSAGVIDMWHYIWFRQC